jgi:YD repeat-containing protein
MADELLRFYQDELDTAKGETAFPGMGEVAFQREAREDFNRKVVNDPQIAQQDLEIQSPQREPDQVTAEGARIWNEGSNVSSIKNADGEIYNFKYDSRGDLAEVTEADGSILTKKGDGHWERVNAEGQQDSFKGEVTVKDGTVAYIGAGGQDRIHAGNGAVIYRDLVNGQKQITKVMQKGKTTEFSYDPDGHVSFVKNPDGTGFTKGSDANWYKRSLSAEDEAVPHKFERQSDGTIVVKTPERITTFGVDGVHRKNI